MKPQTHSIDSLRRSLDGFLKDNSAIVAAWVFGSVASQTDGDGSDIDLAILVDETRIREFSILAAISALEKKLGRPVDVVMLNKAGPLLQHQVRRSGRLIYDSQPEQRKKFEIRGRKAWEDFLYLHRRYTDTVLYERGSQGDSNGEPHNG